MEVTEASDSKSIPRLQYKRKDRLAYGVIVFQKPVRWTQGFPEVTSKYDLVGTELSGGGSSSGNSWGVRQGRCHHNSLRALNVGGIPRWAKLSYTFPSLFDLFLFLAILKELFSNFFHTLLPLHCLKAFPPNLWGDINSVNIVSFSDNILSVDAMLCASWGSAKYRHRARLALATNSGHKVWEIFQGAQRK